MTLRDEPDLRPRCPRCHGLGTETSDYEQSTTGRTRWCADCREYFGRLSDRDSKENNR